MRDEPTLDEKTHKAKFQKEMTTLFKTTEAIKGDRMDTTVFPMAAVALDAEPMAVGLQAIYRGPTGLLEKLELDKGSVCLFRFLVFARN